MRSDEVKGSVRGGRGQGQVSRHLSQAGYPVSAHTQSTAGKLCFTLGVQPGVAFPAKPVSKSLESKPPS